MDSVFEMTGTTYNIQKEQKNYYQVSGMMSNQVLASRRQSEGRGRGVFLGLFEVLLGLLEKGFLGYR